MRILVRKCKKHKTVKKTLVLIVKIVQQCRNPMFYIVFFGGASGRLSGRKRGARTIHSAMSKLSKNPIS